MIHIKDEHWRLLKQPIYLGTDQIKAVYAGSRQVYPLNFYPSYISGLKIGGKTYIPPGKIVIPGATPNSSGVYIEKVTPALYTPIICQKYATKSTTIFWGIYQVAEDISTAVLTLEKSSNSTSFRDGSWTFERYDGNETITEEIPYVGETYYDIVKPIICRYMLVSGWIENGIIEALPEWINLNDYVETTKVKNYTDYVNKIQNAMALCADAAPELFLQEIKVPDGAEFITGGFSTRGGSYELIGSAFNLASTMVLSPIAQAQKVDISGTLPYGTPCSFVNGILPSNGSTAGCIGSIFKVGDDGGLTPFLNSASFASITSISSSGTLTNGTSSSASGQIYTTIDNVITELTTEDNFLWYKGEYTGT